MNAEETPLTREQEQAVAAAADYEDMTPEVSATISLFPVKQIAGGLLIAAGVIALVTIGVLIFA